MTIRRFLAAGSRYGRLVVIEFSHLNRFGESLYRVACDCGRVCIARGPAMVSGRAKSCGCLREEWYAKLGGRHTKTKHGMSKSPEYRAWHTAKERCLDPTHKSYANYGGRGIVFHPSWVDSFESFYAEVGPRPTPRHSIDRKNNDLGYVPGNVHWATPPAQARNKRSNVFIDVFGERLCLTDWATRSGLHLSCVRSRIRAGWPIEKVLTMPSKRSQR